MCECTFDTLCHECELDQQEAFSVALLGIDADEQTEDEE